MRLSLEFREGTTSDRLGEVTAGLPVVWEKAEGKLHKAEFKRSEVSGAEVIKVVVNACPVSDLHLAEPAIEEIVRDIYREAGTVGQ